MDYKTMTVNDIIEWCKANNQVEWLKKVASTPIEEEGKPARKITFIELKYNFADKFMKEILPPKKPKKPTMFELIENL